MQWYCAVFYHNHLNQARPLSGRHLKRSRQMMSRPFKGSMSYNPFLGLFLGSILKIYGILKLIIISTIFIVFWTEKYSHIGPNNPKSEKNWHRQQYLVLARLRVYQCAKTSKSCSFKCQYSLSNENIFKLTRDDEIFICDHTYLYILTFTFDS